MADLGELGHQRLGQSKLITYVYPIVATQNEHEMNKTCIQLFHGKSCILANSDTDASGRGILREMGGAPRNPAPRNHLWVWIVKPSGCHCIDASLVSASLINYSYR